MFYRGVPSTGMTMPAKTEKQRRAMAAAAAGKSTLGIPQSVGREFMGGGSKKYSTGGTVSGAVGNPHGERMGMGGMEDREKARKKVKKQASGKNPGYKQRAQAKMLRKGSY